MYNNLPVLPDWFSIVFIIIGIIGVFVYIMEVVREYKDYRRECIREKLMKRIAESKKSDRLAAFYAAAALGDEEDFSYYYNTAKKFM